MVTAVDTSANESGNSTEAAATPALSASVEVTGIDLDSASRGDTILVTIFGSGFQTGAQVALTGGQGPAPSVTNVVVVDSNTITATISVPAKGGPPRPRLWDIVVTNPDGSSDRCEGCFTVNP